MTVPYPGCSLRECAEIPDRSRQPTQFVTSRDELFSTAVASVLEAGEWAMTAEFKIVFSLGAQSRPFGRNWKGAPPQPLARFSRGSSGRRGRAGRGDRDFNLGRVAPPVKPRPQCSLPMVLLAAIRSTPFPARWAYRWDARIAVGRPKCRAWSRKSANVWAAGKY
jgi:hypothetical protein